MDEGSPFQTQPAYVGKSSNKKRLVVIFIVVFLLIVAGLGALYLLGSTAKKSTNPPTNPIPTQAIAVTPTIAASSSAKVSTASSPTTAAITGSPTVNPAKLTVGVLNGSGTPGAAGEVADALKNAGLTNVTTGNASNYNYTGITIIVKKAESSYLPQLKKDVSSANASAKITTKVDNTIPTDIQVIVGK